MNDRCAPLVARGGGDTSDFWEAVDDVADFVHEWADGCRNGDRARDAIATIRDLKWGVIKRASLGAVVAPEGGKGHERQPAEPVCSECGQPATHLHWDYFLCSCGALVRPAQGVPVKSLGAVVAPEGGESGASVPAPAVPMEGEPGPSVQLGAARASAERKRMLEEEAAALLRALSHSREVSMSMAALREVRDWADRWDEAAQPIDSAQDLANDPVVGGGER